MFEERKYLATTLEPLHVGTGGERIGRVDLTVVREPALNVPKIPGTTFSGGLKFFTDLKLRDLGIKNNICASAKGSSKDNVHDRYKCPICIAYGYTPEEKEGSGTNTESHQGTLQFSDGLLFAFPVNTWCGPVWITTMQILKDAFDIGDGTDVDPEKITIPNLNGKNSITLIDNNKLNLGWVLLENIEDSVITGELIESELSFLNENIHKRLVILPQWIFSHIVNDNMEVRTSVSIDPETGAAKEGALFTYEAVPRGAVFYLDIVENNYHTNWNNVEWDQNNANEKKPENALDMIKKYGLDGLESVGFAGMTTRGFGRIKLKKYGGKKNGKS